MFEARKAINLSKNELNKTNISNYGGLKSFNILCLFLARFHKAWTIGFGVFEYTSDETIRLLQLITKKQTISLDVCSNTPNRIVQTIKTHIPKTKENQIF